MVVDEIVQKLTTDPAFAAKYTSLPNIEAVQAQAAKDGLSVSTSDIQAVMKAMHQHTGELSEADLSSVAGGMGHGPQDEWCSPENGCHSSFK